MRDCDRAKADNGSDQSAFFASEDSVLPRINENGPLRVANYGTGLRSTSRETPDSPASGHRRRWKA